MIKGETMKEMNNPLQRLLLIISAAMLLVSYGNTCPVQINVKKNTTYHKVINESLEVQCPVSLCTKNFPQMTWCKFDKSNECKPVMPSPGVTLKWANGMKKFSAVYSLMFDSVQLNDTGFYRCSAENDIIMGRTIEVHISETDKNSKANGTTNFSTIEEQNNGSLKHKKAQDWLHIFVWPTLASLCLIIMISSVLVYSLRARKAKHRRQRALDNTEVGCETSPENPQNQGHQPQVDDRTYYPPNMLTLETITEATYGNGLMPNNVAPPAEHSEEQDSIIYADLNHDANKIKAKQQFMDDGQIEYATVCMRT
ncbi:B- and T-lymphocyte attenuator [Xenopus laevis]|uniref:Ig-like domain-containing protein n=2 Tax=Xenopus laevis TaxID=8355 RepID=A0A974DL36_XENLA|nr:B- and T-lymphocyte attenuator [Xenopus laevis]OCT93682.1 hypothetical protein XELAEV_18011357mg [Xenopus laevis]